MNCGRWHADIAICAEKRQMEEIRQKKYIWIRADANEEIASGHLMRMLSVAESLRRGGAEVRFLLAEEESRKWLEKLTGDAEPFAADVLGIPYGNVTDELAIWETFLNCREIKQPDWILVDSYAVTEPWFGELRRLCTEAAEARGDRRPRIAYMDDQMAFDPPVDLVINYDPDAEELAKFYKAAPVRLLGAEYAPLRQQFVGLTPIVRDCVHRVLVSTGGTDPYGMGETLESILRQAAKAKNADVEIVHMGPGYPRIQEVASFLKSCDLAVSAAGTTLYELCAAGVPTLTFSMADNQVTFAGKLAQVGAVDNLGDIRDPLIREKLPERVASWLQKRLEEGKETRFAKAKRMHAITDGNGSIRIAEALLQAAVI